MQDFLCGSGYSLIYYVVLAGMALGMRVCTRIPDEVFRKLLHCILLGSLLVYVFGFDIWWHAVLSCIAFESVVYPVLYYLERFKTFSKTVTERKPGELKNSLVVVFTMFAIVLSVCWGMLNDRLLALASVYAWGFGDAAAALIGKRFGRHKIPGTKKSWEGTLSMFAVSFACVLTILCFRGGVTPAMCGVIAGGVAAVSAAVELYTPGGYDTLTCPLAAMTVMLPMLCFLGGGL